MKNLKIFITLLSILLLPIYSFAQAPASTPIYCPLLSQGMAHGSRGNQVLELQKFLTWHYNILASTIQTGYFGPITKSYVIQFQKQKGVSPIGIVGPLTRNEIVKVCKDFTPPVNFTANVNHTPNQTVGTAPMLVWFSANKPSTVEFYIDFGDGTPQVDMQTIACPLSPNSFCPSGNVDATHTYTIPGVYTARLKAISTTAPRPCDSSLGCAVPPAVVSTWGQITITVK